MKQSPCRPAAWKDGGLASLWQPSEREKFGSNRCFGLHVDCCAPGVGRGRLGDNVGYFIVR